MKTTKKNNLVWKYEAGDKKSIFGKPYTYNGTKWIPDDGVKTDNKGKEKVGANVSAKDADKYLKDNGLEHIDMLSTKSIRRLFDHHGIDWKSMSPKERLNELIKLYGGTGTKPLTEAQKKGLIESLSVKEYACKGASTTLSKQDIQQIEQSAAPRKGGHWGSARSDNNTAKMVAFSSANVFRPIDKNLKEHNFHLDDDNAKRAIALRKYAQERMSQVSRTDHPHIMRGMTLPPDQWQAVIDGKQKNIELTGCTAFTFHKAIRDQYASSNWTQSFGRDKKSIKIMLERDDDVDKSIGMWHDHKKDFRKPAFELLSGLECVTVTKVEHKKNKALPEIRKEKEDTFKRSSKTADREYAKNKDKIDFERDIDDSPLLRSTALHEMRLLSEGKSEDYLKSIGYDDSEITEAKKLCNKHPNMHSWLQSIGATGSDLSSSLRKETKRFHNAVRKRDDSKKMLDGIALLDKFDKDSLVVYRNDPMRMVRDTGMDTSAAFNIHHELFSNEEAPVVYCKAGRYKEKS